MVCLPTLPKRGSTVLSSLSLARVCSTLRGRPTKFGSLREFRLLEHFHHVQVIENAEELVEAVHRRQVFIAVADMALAEQGGGVAPCLEQVWPGSRPRPTGRSASPAGRPRSARCGSGTGR